MKSRGTWIGRLAAAPGRRHEGRQRGDEQRVAVGARLRGGARRDRAAARRAGSPPPPAGPTVWVSRSATIRMITSMALPGAGIGDDAHGTGGVVLRGCRCRGGQRDQQARATEASIGGMRIRCPAPMLAISAAFIVARIRSAAVSGQHAPQFAFPAASGDNPAAMTGHESPNIFALVLDKVRAANTALAADGVMPAGLDQSRIVVEPPRDAAHGDMATNAAMVLAKDAGKKPRDLAEAIAAKLRADPLIDKVDVAGPGFINLTLKPAAWIAELRAVLAAGAGYGRGDLGQAEPVNVEYVSANPTGPMHVGHCRGAVFGDALANLLDVRRLQGDARVLHQRRRRAGRRARALGVPALPRGARRRHRRDPGRALSRRLSQAGRRGAGEGARPRAAAEARERLAAARAPARHRHDDGR